MGRYHPILPFPSFPFSFPFKIIPRKPLQIPFCRRSIIDWVLEPHILYCLSVSYNINDDDKYNDNIPCQRAVVIGKAGRCGCVVSNIFYGEKRGRGLACDMGIMVLM